MVLVSYAGYHAADIPQGAISQEQVLLVSPPTPGMPKHACVGLIYILPVALHQQRNIQPDPRPCQDLVSDHAIEVALYEPANHRKLVVANRRKHMLCFRCHPWTHLQVSADPQILASQSPWSLFQ